MPRKPVPKRCGKPSKRRGLPSSPRSVTSRLARRWPGGSVRVPSPRGNTTWRRSSSGATSRKCTCFVRSRVGSSPAPATDLTRRHALRAYDAVHLATALDLREEARGLADLRPESAEEERRKRRTRDSPDQLRLLLGQSRPCRESFLASEYLTLVASPYTKHRCRSNSRTAEAVGATE